MRYIYIYIHTYIRTYTYTCICICDIPFSNGIACARLSAGSQPPTLEGGTPQIPREPKNTKVASTPRHAMMGSKTKEPPAVRRRHRSLRAICLGTPGEKSALQPMSPWAKTAGRSRTTTNVFIGIGPASLTNRWSRGASVAIASHQYRCETRDVRASADRMKTLPCSAKWAAGWPLAAMSRKTSHLSLRHLLHLRLAWPSAWEAWKPRPLGCGLPPSERPPTPWDSKARRVKPPRQSVVFPMRLRMPPMRPQQPMPTESLAPPAFAKESPIPSPCALAPPPQSLRATRIRLS